jgi:hypothetical protein
VHLNIGGGGGEGPAHVYNYGVLQRCMSKSF